MRMGAAGVRCEIDCGTCVEVGLGRGRVGFGGESTWPVAGACGGELLGSAGFSAFGAAEEVGGGADSGS